MERLRKERMWENQDLNLSQIDIYVWEAEMQVVGKKL